MNAGCTARRWRACCGASSTTTSIWIDGFRSTGVIRCMESGRPGVRNTEWFHMLNADVISMPDKWEYPWYAAWDLAFHTISLSLVDFDFAKEQLLLMLRGLYAHPNGQIPAYEWNFGDVNPPVHAWATLYPLQNRADPRPGGPAVPGAVVSGVDAELQLVGQPQGPRRAQRVRRADFSVWTTSASSTGAPSSPRAARWSRRTGRPGWRSTARTCWRSPSFSPNTTRCTKRSPTSSSSISCGSPTRWTASASIRTRCGMNRTDSFTICCGCPTARRCG